MADLILLNVDFITDIVTNSSSELFIIGTDKTVDQIREILRNLWKTYCESAEIETPFNKVFGDIHKIEEQDYQTIIGFKYYNKSPDSNEYRSSNVIDWDQYDKDYTNWVNSLMPEVIAENSGKIVIYSASDNSIPYSFCILLEEIFNAERIHLG